MLIAALAERDQLLHVGAQILRLRQSRLDLLVLDERRRQVGEQGAAMTARPTELTTSHSMAHDVCLLSCPGFARDTDCSARRRERRERRVGPPWPEGNSVRLSTARRAA